MKILAEYSTERGDAWLVQGETCFGVACRIKMGPGSWRIREFGRMTQEEAIAKFEQFQAELDCRQYSAPRCKYYPSRSRLCKSGNCPAKLGGKDYWAIFSNSCAYKSR